MGLAQPEYPQSECAPTRCIHCGILAVVDPRPECSSLEGHRWLGLSGNLRPLLPRPIVRGDCANVERPCPHIGCHYHLESNKTGESCALDVADKGEHSLEEIGEIMGVTRERVRQIEANALFKLSRRDSQTGPLNDRGTLRSLVRDD